MGNPKSVKNAVALYIVDRLMDLLGVVWRDAVLSTAPESAASSPSLHHLMVIVL